MRPIGSKHELEVRRRAAVLLRRKGLTVRTVAERVGCVPSSVVRWTQAVERMASADWMRSHSRADIHG